VDGAEIGVFEKSNEVGFSGFLKSEDSGALESEFLLEFVGNFSDKSLEWELSDEEISGFLVFSNFSKSDGTRSVSVWLLDTTSGWGALSSGL